MEDELVSDVVVIEVVIELIVAVDCVLEVTVVGSSVVVLDVKQPDPRSASTGEVFP